jgi:hypothetical protein
VAGGRGFLLREKWDREYLERFVACYVAFVGGGQRLEYRERDKERDVDLLERMVEKPRLKF